MHQLKLFVDHQIVRKLVSNDPEISCHPLILDRDNLVIFTWGALFEYLGMGSLLIDLPSFDMENPLFQASLITLQENDDQETVFGLYDRLFAEYLTMIKNLPQMNADFLLSKIHQRNQDPLNLQKQSCLSPTFFFYEKALTERPKEIIHDLILFLAWDRMCVAMSALFDYQSKNPKFIKSLEILKGCLIESYQHISNQGRVRLSFFRLVEALFFYDMREENVDRHESLAWKTLNQSFSILSPRDALPDCYYIDEAMIKEGLQIKHLDERYLTLDSQENVDKRVALTRLIIDQLKSEVSNWNYELSSKKIICL